MPAKTSAQRLQDPKGGLTAAGRKHFEKTEGAHLKPGVMKKESEMSVDEMKRKGSFLRRHYGRKNPFRLVDKKGEPTRYALQAQAWGEKLPKKPEDIERLAAKGHKLLEKAHKLESKSKETAKPKPKTSTTKKKS
jgi:hypothetical protein